MRCKLLNVWLRTAGCLDVDGGKWTDRVEIAIVITWEAHWNLISVSNCCVII
jgi:hypothetical protein